MGGENSTQDERREFFARLEKREFYKIIIKNSARWQERFYTRREETIVQ